MTRRNDLKNALSTGQELAVEILKRRRSAVTKRTAAIKSTRVERERNVASASVRAGTSVGTLIAEGDSWFDYPFNDVLKGLEDDFGYDVESVAKAGDRVEDMAYSGSQLDDLVRRIEKIVRRQDVPKAILLSGGGNDIAGKIELGMLLNHARSNTAGFNQNIVKGVLNERIHYAYVTIISAVTTVCTQMLKRPVPIVLHGYDYPVPDGRGFAGGFWLLPGPWLEPGFRSKGYQAMPERIALMKDLIDQFNDMLNSVAKSPGFSHVHYLDLRLTLSAGSGYDKWWANELHPTKIGFSAVTHKFAQLIHQL